MAMGFMDWAMKIGSVFYVALCVAAMHRSKVSHSLQLQLIQACIALSTMVRSISIIKIDAYRKLILS